MDLPEVSALMVILSRVSPCCGCSLQHLNERGGLQDELDELWPLFWLCIGRWHRVSLVCVAWVAFAAIFLSHCFQRKMWSRWLSPKRCCLGYYSLRPSSFIACGPSFLVSRQKPRTGLDFAGTCSLYMFPDVSTLPKLAHCASLLTQGCHRQLWYSDGSHKSLECPHL